MLLVNTELTVGRSEAAKRLNPDQIGVKKWASRWMSILINSANLLGRFIELNTFLKSKYRNVGYN